MNDMPFAEKFIYKAEPSDDDKNLPAGLRDLSLVVEEYEAKCQASGANIEAMKSAITELQMQSCVGGTFYDNVVDFTSRVPFQKTILDNLLRSAWKHVYLGLNIDKIASAKDRDYFALTLKNPPEFTLDNIRATFGKYLQNPRYHILKGLAECFCDLDPAYKSHSKVRIGVKGLPKRIILSSVGGYGSWGTNRLGDTLNALRAYRGQPRLEYRDITDFMEMSKVDLDALEEWQAGKRYRSGSWVKYQGKPYTNNGSTSVSDVFQIVDRDKFSYGWREMIDPEPSVSLKLYNNGNGHLIFSPQSMLDINRALAEFYGEVLPDAPDDDAKPQASREVSKDLQYYPTPPAVIDRILSSYAFKGGELVLEPSCGDGRILDALSKLRMGIRAVGVEVHQGRAEEAMIKGHQVQIANFLKITPSPMFDLVVMNPPFYGRHYRKHLDHALKFLKDGGALISILPATAHYDHGDLPKGQWQDLPVGSFSESGTNVPTGYLTIRK